VERDEQFTKPLNETSRTENIPYITKRTDSSIKLIENASLAKKRVERSRLGGERTTGSKEVNYEKRNHDLGPEGEGNRARQRSSKEFDLDWKKSYFGWSAAKTTRREVKVRERRRGLALRQLIYGRKEGRGKVATCDRGRKRRRRRQSCT